MTVAQAFSPDHAASLKGEAHRTVGQLPFLVAAVVVIGAITCISALAAILDPGIRPLLLQEDGIIEMASAVVLFLVVAGSAYAICRWGLRLPFAIAGLLGFAELMDETSFGSRIFGFDPPPLYGGGQLDGFHDLLILVFRLARDFNADLAWLWVGILLAGSIALVAFALFRFWQGISLKALAPADHTLLVLHVGLIGLAQAIDFATHSHLLSAMEEVFELNAEILLGFYLAQHAYLASRPGEGYAATA
jgi:hypothetical protein